MLNRRNFLLMVLIVITVVLLFSRIEQPDEPDQAQQNTKEAGPALPDHQFKNLRLVLYNNQQTVSWEILASEVNEFTKRGLLEFSPVTVEANNDEQQGLYLITAEKGLYHNREEKIELSDSVLLKREQQELVTARLSWKTGEGMLSAGEGVRISSPSFIITGQSLQADLTFHHLRIDGNREEQASIFWKEEGYEL